MPVSNWQENNRSGTGTHHYEGNPPTTTTVMIGTLEQRHSGAIVGEI